MAHYKTCEAMAKRHQEEIADMVSVVRCKECRHWDNTDNAERCSHEYGGMWAKPDDFCSYGERREP